MVLNGVQADHTRFETIRYTQQISTILFPDLIDLESEKAFIRQQENALAPKERWENHTSEIQFPGWVKRDPRPILWIGGRQNRRDVSWVSSFALDVIEALEIERSADVASVLCNKGSNLEQPTPLFIFKRMIIQLLQGHPDIVSMPKNLILLPLQRFEQIEKSPEAAYKVLADVLRMIDERNNVESREIFLVIDRIDICLGRENEQGRKRLFRSLQMLSLEYKSVQLILTSQYPAKDMGVLLEGEKHLAEVWMNTTKH